MVKKADVTAVGSRGIGEGKTRSPRKLCWRSGPAAPVHGRAVVEDEVRKRVVEADGAAAAAAGRGRHLDPSLLAGHDDPARARGRRERGQG